MILGHSQVEQELGNERHGAGKDEDNAGRDIDDDELEAFSDLV